MPLAMTKTPEFMRRFGIFRSSRRLTWRLTPMVVVLAAAAMLAVPSVRESLFRAAGAALVTSDPLEPADIIVISTDAGGAGALQAADLVHSGIARRVAVFKDPPREEDLEFVRRGLPYEDLAARQIRQLASLGITDVAQIPRPEAATKFEAEVLAPWCEQHGLRSIVFVVARDHSRRIHRVIDRAMRGHLTRVTIQAEHYAGFDPDRWWKTRTGIRIEIIEFEKLVLDIVRHPMSF